MKFNSKNLKTVFVVAIVLILSIAVAFAALSTTLSITFGNITQDTLTWNVGFETGSVSGTKSGSAAASCGTATVTANSASISNTVLATLHDKCTYALTIKNTGTIDALLSTISAQTPSGITCDSSVTSKMVCGNITYKLTTDSAGNNLLATDLNLVKTTGTLPVYLIAEYTGTEVSQSAEHSNCGFTLNYTQN